MTGLAGQPTDVAGMSQHLGFCRRSIPPLPVGSKAALGYLYKTRGGSMCITCKENIPRKIWFASECAVSCIWLACTNLVQVMSVSWGNR